MIDRIAPDYCWKLKLKLRKMMRSHDRTMIVGVQEIVKAITYHRVGVMSNRK
jgi:hypothetical protein